MFKSFKYVFFRIFYEVEKIPLTILFIAIMLIILLTIILVCRELKDVK